MIELDPNQFEAIRLLLTPLNHYLPVTAVLAGDVSGRVFVDSEVAPKTAVCWANRRVYLAGRADGVAQAAVRQLFQARLLPAMRAADVGVYTLCTDHNWLDAASVALPFLPPLTRARCLYRIDARGRDWDVIVPPGLRLRPVDAALLADETITNLDYVTDEMASERPSLDAFLARSSGVCLQHKSEIVGWCLSEYNSGHRCEIGIAVAEGWRRRGLATLLAQALIGVVAAQGVHDIGWLCWADNVPSVKLAEALGFALADKRDNFMGFLDAWLHFAVHGNLAMENGRYTAAANFYRQAIPLTTSPPWLLWNAACAASRTGALDEAAGHLQAAIAAGFADRGRLSASPHLAALRETAAWTTILDALGDAA